MSGNNRMKSIDVTKKVIQQLKDLKDLFTSKIKSNDQVTLQTPSVEKTMQVKSNISTQQSTSSTTSKNPIINIIDRSTLLNDADHALMVEACKIQLEKHVAPLWNKGPWTIVEDQPDTVGFPIVILDDPDQAGVLGYHTKSPGGKVWARVFVKPVTSRGGSMTHGSLSVSAVLSHEIIEAYCNPNINIWARRSDGTLVAHEACDPVENDSYDVTTANGTKVTVSNFVLPSWFDPYPSPGTQFDYMNILNRPFTMSSKGYIVTLDPKTGGVKNVFGSKEAEDLHTLRQDPHPAARSHRMSPGPEIIQKKE